MTTLTALLAQAVPQLPVPDPLAGGSGWVGAGLLGLVLAWLLLKHLPAKDAQMMDLLRIASEDREKDRAARHLMANHFQQMLAGAIRDHDEALERSERQHAEMLSAVKQESVEAKKELREALSLMLAHCVAEGNRLVETFRAEVGRLVQAKNSKAGGREQQA